MPKFDFFQLPTVTMVDQLKSMWPVASQGVFMPTQRLESLKKKTYKKKCQSSYTFQKKKYIVVSYVSSSSRREGKNTKTNCD